MPSEVSCHLVINIFSHLEPFKLSILAHFQVDRTSTDDPTGEKETTWVLGDFYDIPELFTDKDKHHDQNKINCKAKGDWVV